MNSDRSGRCYLAAFFVAVGLHAVLLTALPARPPSLARKLPPVEVELVAASSLEALAPEPSSAPPEPPSAQPDIPPEPEPAVEVSAPEPAESIPDPPPPETAVLQAMPLPKVASQPSPSSSKPPVVSQKTAPSAAPGKRTGGGSPGGPSGVVREARPDAPRNRPPPYPEMARRNGWHGRVIVRVDVSAAGRVTSISLHRGSGYGVLDQAALAAVKSWRFLHGTVGGVAVETVVEVPVNFSLRR